MRIALASVLMAICLLMAPQRGWAQSGGLTLPADFPAGWMQIIVPYASGGGSHAVATAMAAELEQIVGRKVVVRNLPKQSGMEAVDEFMKRPETALTILQHIDDAASAFAAGDLPYDPAKDWVPLGITQITYSQLYIRARDKRFHDSDTFLAYVFRNPGLVRIGNVGKQSSAEQVNIRLLEEALGIDVKQVPIDKPANRYMSVILGTVDAMLEQPGDVSAFLDRKLYTPVLTFRPDRPRRFSETPALLELGANFKPLLRFRGFFVRRGVPDHHVDYLEAAVKRAYDSPGYQAFNERNYMDTDDGYRDRAGSIDMINEAVATYRKAFKMMGLLN